MDNTTDNNTSQDINNVVQESIKPINIDKVDIEILYIVLANTCTTTISSMTIQDITDAMELNRKSYHTYSKRIKEKLIPLGYIDEGLMDSRSRTYYITKKGIEFLDSKNIKVVTNNQ